VQLNPVQLDRAAGVLVAAAAGDALGAGYEFARPPAPDEVSMKPGRLTRRPAGSWTDDTDLAVAVANVAATGARLDEESGLVQVAAEFIEWYRSGPDDIGLQTRSVLAAARSPEDLASCAATYAESHARSAGNGSLMRTGPVALAHLGDDEAIMEAAGLVSALTHDDPLAREACGLWCIAIDRAIREGRIDGVHDGVDLLPTDRRDYWRERLGEAEQPSPTVIRSNTFVVTALQAAWWAVWSASELDGPEHLDAALRRSVAIGDDTDTVAAIAGALLGARYGASAVPFAWRRHLAGWPHGMRAADLVALAILAVRGGKPDSAGWPASDDLMPYYRRHFAPRGFVVELPEDEGVQWGDVRALAASNADAFVSLCRIGKLQRRGPDHSEVWLMDAYGPEQNADPGFVLSDTADAIQTLRREGKTVFVHCVRSESRTPAVAVAWLVRHHGRTVEEAMTLVASHLPTYAVHAPLQRALHELTEKA
jgi:ADP-ribosyl-[dinitrogen reductase] hydrolase